MDSGLKTGHWERFSARRGAHGGKREAGGREGLVVVERRWRPRGWWLLVVGGTFGGGSRESCGGYGLRFRKFSSSANGSWRARGGRVEVATPLWWSMAVVADGIGGNHGISLAVSLQSFIPPLTTDATLLRKLSCHSLSTFICFLTMMLRLSPEKPVVPVLIDIGGMNSSALLFFIFLDESHEMNWCSQACAKSNQLAVSYGPLRHLYAAKLSIFVPSLFLFSIYILIPGLGGTVDWKFTYAH
ncbi:hypothetical protein Cgig2_024375 [Carnegiea gigantea]|uniref:Uncharacterized protein n=1 Tax=Carnegiea gigantea TaxID=171969 RepID=A0A9Q1GMR2_9CARY|nr:hypothetical protein Cgig2_024375 [Carnegiea gigantea]